MVVSERSLSEHTVVETFVGRFDQHARQDFKWRIDHAITQGYRFVVLNMVAVSFIDSAALGWLVLAQRRFQRIHRVVREAFMSSKQISLLVDPRARSLGDPIQLLETA